VKRNLVGLPQNSAQAQAVANDSGIAQEKPMDPGRKISGQTIAHHATGGWFENPDRFLTEF
jgi:hypothetical protein